MNYESMSDLEINKLVKSKVKEIKDREFAEWSNAQGINPVNIICSENIYSIQVPDYCNSWADMGPIIEGNKIMVLFDPLSEKWFATNYFNSWLNDEPVFHDSPLRAAAIVFLMSQEGK